MRGKPHLGERGGGVRVKARSGKGGLHRERRQIPRRTGMASKKSLSRRGRRKHERVSGRQEQGTVVGGQREKI